MSTTEDILRDILALQVKCPFDIDIDAQPHRLQYCLRGSAGPAIVVDKDAGKLATIAAALKAQGYASACFDLATGDFDEFCAILDAAGIVHD